MQPHQPGSSASLDPSRSPATPAATVVRTAPVVRRSPDPAPVAHAGGAPRKLDELQKCHVADLVACGHSLSAAARMVGVSERTLYREKKRDSHFRAQLRKERESIANLCIKSLRQAAPDKPYAATQLYKFVYPDRYYYRPETITRKQHDAWTNEVFSLFESIATPEQMRELHRQLNGDRKRSKRSQRNMNT